MQKKKSSLWLFLAGVATLIVLLIAFMPAKKSQPEAEKYKLETSGAGTNADYTAASMALHASVDTVLTSQRITVKQAIELSRQVPRRQLEGDIRWHTRHLLVEKPRDVAVETIVNALAIALPKIKGKILSAEPDFFQGHRTQRLDIGIEDKLENEPLTIISDKIYILSDSSISTTKPTTTKAEMAIIIDDFGYSAEPIPAFCAIKQALTFSVLPYRPYSNEAAANALSAGHQVMLHLPMEPQSQTNDREPVVISSSMTDTQIKDNVLKALSAIPGVTGVNNHQGSKSTTDTRVMQAVMTAIKPNTLFFVDSRTIAASVAAATAKKAGLRTAENELFIDNNPEISAIKQQLQQAIRLALQHKRIIIIGHARLTTAIALREMLPEIEAAGIKLVFASQLVK